jgi:hypothetical protein
MWASIRRRTARAPRASRRTSSYAESPGSPEVNPHLTSRVPGARDATTHARVTHTTCLDVKRPSQTGRLCVPPVAPQPPSTGRLAPLRPPPPSRT